MPSRSKKTRGVTVRAIRPAPGLKPASAGGSVGGPAREPANGAASRPAAGASPGSFGGPARGAATSPAPAPAARGPQAEAAAPPAAGADPALPAPSGTQRGASSRRALKNWRVRSRLLLLITIPTLTALVLGGIRIVSSVQSALAYQRVENLASLTSKVTGLTSALENERDQIVSYIALGASAGGRQAELHGGKAGKSAAQANLLVVQQTISYTRPWEAQVRRAAAGIGDAYPADVQQEAQSIIAELDALPDLRRAALSTDLPALNVVQKYTSAVDNLLTVEGQVALGSNDAQLASSVRALGLISRIEEEASQQRGLLTVAFTDGRFPAGTLAAINAALAQQTSNLNEFTSTATASERALYQSLVSGTLVDRANSQEQQAISGNPPLAQNPTTAPDWYGASSNTISRIRAVEQHLMASIITRASALRGSAITSAVIVGAAVILVLVLALVFTAFVGRSMVRPLRRLRASALEIAGLRLPETVRRMSETDGEGVSLDVEPIDVDSTDEIGEVARAFDQVHREALRLAANEAALRGNVNAMFVNLSRRSQSLVERQIRLIDNLEQGEQDSERLSSLFQMDHLATRMRRNSENLLVLAGHDASRRWNQPVALVDVLRAAVSEIEQYERVTLNVQPGIAVRGQAVNDVVHLLAELVENATSFSSAETPVSVSGHLLSSGGVLLDITDQGVGMGAEEMAHANWRLDNPPVVDVAVSRRMGLFVVARLAARHGIRVRLRPAGTGGLTALVWLPDEAVTHEGQAPSVPAPRRVGETAMTATADTTAGLAEVGGLADDDWGSDGRISAAEQEVTAARTPKFGQVPGETSETRLGPRRVPGTTGSRPGSAWGTTGPLPAFSPDAEPVPADASDPTVTRPQQVVSAAPGPAEPEQQAYEEPVPEAGPPPAVSYAAFGTGPTEAIGPGPEPATPPESEVAATEASPVLRAPTNGGQVRPDSHLDGLTRFAWETGSANGDVVVPPAGLGQENRLPIFEAVESDWFRHGRNAVGWAGREEEPVPAANGWTSPADEGWRAAEVAAAPSSGGTTAAGLPKRVPQANLVPGTAAGQPSPAPAPARSAAATRDRLASFQRGVREGRAALRGGDAAEGEDATS